MDPTIRTKERVLVDEYAYMMQKPQRGDVVVYRSPGDVSVSGIKRIVGLPSETVELRKSKLFINGKELAEAWGHVDTEKAAEDYGPVSLSPAEYFLLGDNRSHSFDSRSHGAVALGFIHGRVLRVAGEGGVRPVR